MKIGAVWVGSLDFRDEKIGELVDTAEIVQAGDGLVWKAAFEVSEGLPSDEVGWQPRFAVGGENGFKLPHVIGRMERCLEMSPPAKLKPSGKRLVCEVQGEEVLKIVKGKEKVG